MAYPPRRYTSATDKAEAMFKAATTKPKAALPASERQTVSGAKETISVKIDSDVLAHFQNQGPGWQERINTALRKAAGLI